LSIDIDELLVEATSAITILQEARLFLTKSIVRVLDPALAFGQENGNLLYWIRLTTESKKEGFNKQVYPAFARCAGSV
jgi:hypothetical protein